MVEEENTMEYNFTLYHITVPSTDHISSNKPLRCKKFLKKISLLNSLNLTAL
jgi:hypothetical protein